ncbi:MAG: histidine phosphatase family protein [Syntrophorhabdales bacterium]|jgi:broad specificity phosphatase PhoE
MDIYLVRHGETQWNKEEVFRGRKDIPLNETGRRQAEQGGAYFRGIPVKRIISSPLARAVETAAGISAATGVPVERMEELTDINFGIWEGLSLKEVEERYPAAFALWGTSPEKLRIADGETLAEVRERISRGLTRLAGLAGAVAIVTHRAICKILVLSLLHMGNEHFWAIKYDPGSITLLEGDDARCTLIFSNDTCHQRDGLQGARYRDF